jgi:pyruvate-formate lyase-activating enzyme
MHLTEILSLRPVTAGGMYLALTRRCPLTCAHCSTNSMMSSQEHSAEIFARFVDTLRPDDRPSLLYLTGGEALLRPELVRQVTIRAHEVGARVALLSGMFFARQDSIPPAVRHAIAEVDHFAASLDIFHERQVPRAAVLSAIHRLLDQGKDLSFQVTGIDDEDPYLEDVTDDIRHAFDDRVPILVAKLGAVGRAKEWYAEERGSPHPKPYLAPDPCAMATWPTVAFDGTILACCNQDAVDGKAPPHLRLGHAAVDDWPTVRARCESDTLLRAIRVHGPRYLQANFGSQAASCDGYCAACFKLSDYPDIIQQLEPIMNTPGMRVVEAQVASWQQQTLARQYGVGRYSDLATLGLPSSEPEAAA